MWQRGMKEDSLGSLLLAWQWCAMTCPSSGSGPGLEFHIEGGQWQGALVSPPR